METVSDERGTPRAPGASIWSRGELMAGGLLIVLLALATSAQGIVGLHGMGADIEYLDLLLRHSVMWLFWGAAALGIAPLWSWSSERLSSGQHWALHVTGSALVSVVSWQLMVLLAGDIARRLVLSRFDGAPHEPGLRPLLLPGLMIYWTICGLASLRAVRHGLAAQRLEAHRAGQRNAELEASLQAARFDLLQRQVQPHFLFNALNTVACLADEGQAERTREVVLSLAGVLRSTIDATSAESVTLESEIRVARQYLDVQRARFGERLEVHWSIDEKAHGVQLPPLLIITLVENVVEHALGGTTDPVTLEVIARRGGDGVQLVVRDDGPGFPDQVLAGHAEGTGIANSRARLDHLHAGRQRLSLANRPQGGAEVGVLVKS